MNLQQLLVLHTKATSLKVCKMALDRWFMQTAMFIKANIKITSAMGLGCASLVLLDQFTEVNGAMTSHVAMVLCLHYQTRLLKLGLMGTKLRTVK